jgi:mannose-6-phosphate isomerase-like protein (cupin superfamily)
MGHPTAEQIVALGFTSEVMGNGELRVRTDLPGGDQYIYTIPPADIVPQWQNAHYHKGVRETYIVQKGRIALASVDCSGLSYITYYKVGQAFTTEVGIPHNVYLYAGSAIHTIKSGTPVPNPDRGGADWYPADDDFDRWSKSQKID